MVGAVGGERWCLKWDKKDDEAPRPQAELGWV